MESTLEISMYPLREDYEPSIIAFIQHLKDQEGFEVRVNETSTHLFGNFELIMAALTSGIQSTWEIHGRSVFVVKILGANLKGSADHL